MQYNVNIYFNKKCNIQVLKALNINSLKVTRYRFETRRPTLTSNENYINIRYKYMC
jgi:hypothetical protein